jgi:hypothetical protein
VIKKYIFVEAMRKELQKYLSLLLLVLFLFPMLEKQRHAFEHVADKHCTANEKHFHEEEHHCSICDFTITDSTTSTSAYRLQTLSIQQASFSVLPQSIYFPDAFQSLPSRAPPVA